MEEKSTPRGPMRRRQLESQRGKAARAAGKATIRAKLAEKIDPDGTMPVDEREQRVDEAYSDYYRQKARLGAATRAARRAAAGPVRPSVQGARVTVTSGGPDEPAAPVRAASVTLIDPATWERPDVREALAAHDIGRLYRLLGEHTELGQREIAALSGQSQSTVSELVNGRRGTTVVCMYSVLDRIATGLGIPRDLMGLSWGAYSGYVTVATPSEGDEEMLRRDLLARGATALVGVPVLGALLETPLARGDVSLPSQVGLSDVAEIRSTIDQLRTAARAQGGQARAVSAAAIEYGRLTGVPATDTVSSQLGSALAELHELAGWCCYDVGHDRHARWHYREAGELAQHAGDQARLVDVLHLAGIQDVRGGRPNEALKLYQIADSLITEDEQERAWGHALSANALVLLDGQEHAAGERLRAARDGWSPGDEFERADMDYETALVHFGLADLDTAESSAAVAVGRSGRHRPVGVLASVLQATCHVRTGEPDGPTIAATAIDRVAELRSLRARQRLLPLADALDGRRRSDCRHLAHRARQIAGTVAA